MTPRTISPTLCHALATTLDGDSADVELVLPDALPPVLHDPRALSRAFGDVLRTTRDGGALRVAVSERAVEAREVSELAAGRYLEVTIEHPVSAVGERDLGACQTILRHHHGLATAAPRRGERGTCFTILLPVADAPRAAGH